MNLLALRTGNLGDVVNCSMPSAAYFDASTDKLYSLAELDAAATSVALAATRKGWRTGSRVGLLCANGAAFTAGYLGLLRAGFVAVPINYKLSKETIQFIMRDCGVSAVFASEEFASLPEKTTPVIEIAALSQPNPSEDFESIRPAPEQIAQILYTSGSTGRPKGVPLTHKGQLWALDQFIRTAPQEAQRTVVAAPSYHMNGLFFTTVCLALGYFTVSVPRYIAADYLRIIARERCTLLSGIPTMFAMAAREAELVASLDLSSVKDVLIGSAPLTQALSERILGLFPNAAIRNSYGTTETGPAMFGPHPDGLPRPPLALGYPYPGVEWRLRDSEHHGELLSRTPATLKNYLNLPELTRTKLDDGWYSTGDILKRDENGFFYFVGRSDDMFVCGGENIYPNEIEKLLERNTAVLQAAVVPVVDEIKGAIPIAFVVTSPGKTISETALKTFSLENGPAYAHPRRVIFVEELPMNGVHKIDRTKLLELASVAVAASKP